MSVSSGGANNHLPRCGAVAKCNPGGQPSTSVQSATAWVQRMGGHLWMSKWRFAVRHTYQTYIYTYIRTEVRLRRHKGARFARPNYYMYGLCAVLYTCSNIFCNWKGRLFVHQPSGDEEAIFLRTAVFSGKFACDITPLCSLYKQPYLPITRRM